MTFTRKKIVLTAIGSVVALSFVVFAVLFVKYDRAADRNNEDAILAYAQRAEAEDNPPLAAWCWRRLTALNPFKAEYADRYCHALVRMRNFRMLATYTNDHPASVVLTDGEKEVERLLARGVELEAAFSNELAAVCYAKATNLNYYASVPFLIDCEARIGRIGAALDAARAYIKRFPDPTMALHTAEWCALAARPDLVDETRRAVPATSGYSGLVFGYYCDALNAWIKGDKASLAVALKEIDAGAFNTPVARLMALESAADGDNPSRVQAAYWKLAKCQRLFDFPERGKAAVKRFIAAHFPSGLPIVELGRLADMVLDGGHADVELLRISLLVRLETGRLGIGALDEAELLYPGDKGLKKIREGYERALAETH